MLPALWIMLSAISLIFVVSLTTVGTFVYIYEILKWGYEQNWFVFILLVPVAILIIAGVVTFYHYVFFG